MFPTDPIHAAQHIRLMTELKTLYIKAVIQADLKEILFDRIQRYSGWSRRQSNQLEPVLASPDYFSNQRIAIYTAIFGPVDIVHEPLTIADNCDYFIFTDQTVSPDSTWKQLPLDQIPPNIRQDNVLANRYVKMFPDLFFPEYDVTIYLDGKFQIRTDLTEFIHDLPKHGLRMFSHPLRNCVYDEIKTCIQQGKGSREALQSQAKHLKTAGMPVKYGMLEGSIIIRQVGNSLCQTLMSDWWQEFLLHSRRDQVALPFILWQHQIPIESVAIPQLDIWTYPAIKKWPHVKKKK
ncbi:MAG: DUF616 domain-containing protein [Eubacteriales bacterium]|nr:DUF616 domain-containing protein [Eubacteriales bacterium]